MKSKLPPPPRFEYVEDFLSSAEATELFNRLKELPGYKFETGSCDLEPTHSTVQFGPRQAYLDCVPKVYRVQSSGDIPDFLAVLKDRLEQIYDCTFNSVQINQHYDHNSTVHAHHDSNPGHICMISVGAERDFCLHYQRPWHKEFARIKLANGSLLTLFPEEQWKMKHRMPRSETPCGIRFSIILRYIPVVLTQTMPKNVLSAKERKTLAAERDAEYEAAQQAGREKRRNRRKLA